VRELALEAGAGGTEKLAEDIKDFHEMYADFKLKDEAQEVIAITVGVYTGCWHFFGAAFIYAAVAFKGTIPEYTARGISDAWFSVFMIASCLNNVGLSLLDDSMMPLVDRPAPLMIMAFAMILGNTAWPVALRSILWLLHKAFPSHRGIAYTLAHDQETCPSLFSSAQTWGLVAAVLVTNIFQVAMFMACSLELVRDGRSTVTLLYLAFFQCVNSRSSGLQVFDLKRLSKNMMVIFGFMMWYAPTPLVGIIAGEEFNMAFHNNPVLSGFIKKYTNRHTSWLFLVFVIISTAEQKLLADSGNWPMGDKPSTTLFNILFEMLSAYGTNGLSMGFPGVNHSLSGMFRPVSKLSIMFLMIMGRHRSMQGKSDPSLMQSLAQLEAHCERLREQRIELGAPAAEARRSASVASMAALEMGTISAADGEEESARLVMPADDLR
jgi:Trk-type K+ transport system membrane component